MKDFEMIKTLITTRLIKAYQEECARINEYNQKASALRGPTMKKIVEHYSANPDLKHPFGMPLSGQKNITVQMVGDDTVQISASYSDNDGLGNACNFNGSKRVKISSKLSAELKKYPLLQAPVVDVNNTAIEKSAAIVLSGGDVMKEVDKALEGALPKAVIPKI